MNDGGRNTVRESLWSEIDPMFHKTFLNDSIHPQQRYNDLFYYLINGFIRYRTIDGAHAFYPGEPSNNGSRIDAMEGFTRILPLISAWLGSSRNPDFKSYDGRILNLMDLARDGLIAGTDEKSAGYWGHINDYDQRAYEAGDVALSLWLLRDSLWVKLDEPQKKRIVAWLLEINNKKIWNNNWHVSPILVNMILKAFGYPIDDAAIQSHYGKLKSFYKGNGWFSDGPDNVYDYYNAWSIHYCLFWISLIDPSFDEKFIKAALREFLEYYKYFFSPAGIPIMGRSLCYRIATPSPLVAGAFKTPNLISPGLARRALDCTWKYFISKGALAGGNLTQGYCGEDLRIVDNYSGPASCLFSLRSLVVAFLHRPDSAFWTAPEEQLPVERTDYSILIPSINWKIEGLKAEQRVQIIIDDNAANSCGEIRSYGLIRKTIGKLLGRPYRPNNHCVKYRQRTYSSSNPFCGCN